MPEDFRRTGEKPDADIDRPNISTRNQPKGAAGRPDETLDRRPRRDPLSGAPIPADYNPATMTREGEEDATRAARQGAGRRDAGQDDSREGGAHDPTDQ